MRRVLVGRSFFLLLAGMLVWSVSARSQAAAAQGNPPAGNPAPQAGGRGPTGPAPGPPHDPHDLSGVWNMRRGYGGNAYGRVGPDLTEWGQEQFKLSKSSNAGDYTLEQTNDPVITRCYPPGTPRIYLQPFPFEIVQTPKETLLLYEYDHTVRRVFTDGRTHPEDVTPTYMGDSIGHWEGDTFVVDTVGFNTKTWLDRVGHAHSDQLHVIERFKRVNLNDLELDVTMEDAKALKTPWTVHMSFQVHADWSIEEQVCTDNGDFVNFEK